MTKKINILISFIVIIIFSIVIIPIRNVISGDLPPLMNMKLIVWNHEWDIIECDNLTFSFMVYTIDEDGIKRPFKSITQNDLICDDAIEYYVPFSIPKNSIIQIENGIIEGNECPIAMIMVTNNNTYYYLKIKISKDNMKIHVVYEPTWKKFENISESECIGYVVYKMKNKQHLKDTLSVNGELGTLKGAIYNLQLINGLR
jgi:hypothetical protein